MLYKANTKFKLNPSRNFENKTFFRIPSLAFLFTVRVCKTKDVRDTDIQCALIRSKHIHYNQQTKHHKISVWTFHTHWTHPDRVMWHVQKSGEGGGGVQKPYSFRRPPLYNTYTLLLTRTALTLIKYVQVYYCGLTLWKSIWLVKNVKPMTAKRTIFNTTVLQRNIFVTGLHRLLVITPNHLASSAIAAKSCLFSWGRNVEWWWHG